SLLCVCVAYISCYQGLIDFVFGFLAKFQCLKVIFKCFRIILQRRIGATYIGRNRTFMLPVAGLAVYSQGFKAKLQCFGIIKLIMVHTANVAKYLCHTFF